MRQCIPVLLPMTDPLTSIPQSFSYLTRAVSVGIALSMSCSYLTRAVSVGIVLWSLFWNPRRSDMMSRMWCPYFFSTAAFSDRSIHFWNSRSITFGSNCCCTSCHLSVSVRFMKCVYLAHASAYRSVCAINTPYDPSFGMFPDKSGKLAFLTGKSSRWSYSDVTISFIRVRVRVRGILKTSGFTSWGWPEPHCCFGDRVVSPCLVLMMCSFTFEPSPNHNPERPADAILVLLSYVLI